MNARVPQDVDLEDRLIYGLSPIRFGYLVIAVLGTLSLWRLEALPPWLRAGPCLVVLAAGAVLAWGHWRGRAVDRWLLDVAVFVRRNYALGLHPSQPRRGVAVPMRAIGSIAGRDGRT